MRARALAIAALLAGCGVKAPPRPPLKPGAAAPAPTGAAQPDSGERASGEAPACGSGTTSPPSATSP